MVIGQFDGVVDEKKRSALPKKFRDKLGNSLIVTKGLDSQLLVVPQSSLETLLEGTAGKPFIQKDVRDLQRFLLGNAFEIELDSKGRFVMPDYLSEYAHITDTVVFVGVGNYVEIWDSTRWHEYQQKLIANENITKITERLVKEGTHE